MTNIFDQKAQHEKEQRAIGSKDNDLATQATNNQSKIQESDNNQQQTRIYDSQLKSATQELIKFGVLEMSNKPNLYQTCIRRSVEVDQILEPLDLKLKIDDIRGLAFIVVAIKDSFEHSDDWQHPLVRRHRMNLEQSLMVAILRQHFMAHELDAGIGDHRAIIHLDDLLPQLNQFLGASGSDAKDDKRLRLLLEQLKGYGLVTDIDENEKVTIRPLIAHVANPENLKNLIATLKQHLKEQSP